MSESGGIRWGKVIMGAAVVTAVAAACVFIGSGLGDAFKGAATAAGESIRATGNSIEGIGTWIGEKMSDLAKYGTGNKAATLVTAAVTGALGMVAATSFVDRFNRSAEMIGVDTGRGR